MMSSPSSPERSRRSNSAPNHVSQSVNAVSRCSAVGCCERVLRDDDVLERDEVLALGRGDPHDREEDRRRKRITPLDVGVGLAPVDELVDELVGRAADARLECSQLLRREHRIEELAPLRVLRTVELERDRDVVPAEAEAGALAPARQDVGHRAAAELTDRVRAGERLDVAHLPQHDETGFELLDPLRGASGRGAPGGGRSSAASASSAMELSLVCGRKPRGLLGHECSSLLPGVVPAWIGARMDRAA